MAYTDGLDVSHWVNVRWLEWKNNGYVFAWIKTTEDTGWVDNRWEEHYADATAQDFYVAPYHYFRVRSNGALQAQHFFDTVKDHEWDMVPMVDVEKINNIKADGSRLVSQAVFAARLRNFLFECEALFGVKPIIYTSRSTWQFLIGSVAWASAYDLWTAHYTTYPVPLIPNDWSGKGWTVWQYIDRPLDQNRFNGSFEEFLEWMGVSIPTPPSNGDWDEARVAAIEAQLALLHGAFHPE